MSTIQNQSLAAGLSPGQNALSDAQFSSYVRKQSLNAYESLDAGLTIKTKEGDLVTLTSNTFSEFDAFSYDSKGVIQTESGKAVATQNQREITLTSGESFSFSVVGNLSESELEDIEAIVAGIDEVMSQMVEGDMDDAVAAALSMGGYDSVSMYSADISYQKSYSMTSEIQAETIRTMPEPGTLPKEEALLSSVNNPYPENRSPWKKRNNTIENIEKFVDQMSKKFEKLDDKLMDRIEKPINKLFGHHLKNAKKNYGEDKSLYNAIENSRNQIEKLIDSMSGKIFKDHFSAVL